MVAATGTQASQLQVLVVTDGVGGDLQASQAQVSAVYNYPSEATDVSQLQVTAVTDGTNIMRATQLQVLAVVRGRISNRKARVWQAHIDGHGLYIIRLGELETLVYDDTTEQWYNWDSGDLSFLRQHVGTNWVGMGQTTFNDYGQHDTNIIAGDDTYGLLWLTDPTLGYDQDPRDAEVTVEFTRQVTGGLPIRLREASPVGAAYLTASLGTPSVVAPTIRLRTSDDSGNTWVDQGSITVTDGDFNQEFSWRSLGLIKAPGRIFEITDNGGTVRIDGLDMR
jgi:hypothetical protein